MNDARIIGARLQAAVRPRTVTIPGAITTKAAASA